MAKKKLVKKAVRKSPKAPPPESRRKQKSAKLVLFKVQSLELGGGRMKAVRLTVEPEKELVVALSAKDLALSPEGYLTIESLQKFGKIAASAIEGGEDFDEDEKVVVEEEEEEEEEEETSKKKVKGKASKSSKKSKKGEDENWDDFDLEDL